MKRCVAVSMVLLLSALWSSVARSAGGTGVEGNVIDGQGKALAGVIVKATMKPPIIKGYEQVQARTGSDGKFSLQGLYPGGRYAFSFSHQLWISDVALEGAVMNEGETLMLPESVVIAYGFDKDGRFISDPQTGKPRFALAQTGVITDSETGTKWFPGPDKATTLDEALKWAENLQVDGGGWRLPDLKEIRSIVLPACLPDSSCVDRTFGFKSSDTLHVWLFYREHNNPANYNFVKLPPFFGQWLS